MGPADGATPHATQSFVLRVWVEEPPEEPRRGATWRGWILHVQSGDECTVDGLAAVRAFLVRHLGAVGVRPPLADRVRLMRRRP